MSAENKTTDTTDPRIGIVARVIYDHTCSTIGLAARVEYDRLSADTQSTMISRARAILDALDEHDRRQFEDFNDDNQP